MVCDDFLTPDTITTSKMLQWEYCQGFPVKGDFFLSTVTKCLLTGGRLIVGVFSVLLTLPYNIKQLEVTVAVIQRYIL